MQLTQTQIAESTWTVPLIALLLVGMLAAFYAVVSSAAEAGQLRRNASATQAAAAKRCDALPGWHLGKACRKDLDVQASIALAAR